MAAYMNKVCQSKYQCKTLNLCINNSQLRRKTSSNRKTSSRSTTSTEYCMDLVKKYDHENYLCTLLLPSSCRTSAFAIRAFNTEIALVGDQVRESRIGRMRLQFWRETLDNIYQDKPPKQPVGMELHRAVRVHNLSKRWLQNLIDSRDIMLMEESFRNLPAVEQYAEKSVSPVYYLILEALGLKNVHADHVGSHLGKSQGLVTLLRGIPYNAGQHKVYIPMQLLMDHGISQEGVLRGGGKEREKMQNAVLEIATLAKTHFNKSRSLLPSCPPSSHVVFLPGVATGRYLVLLEKANFDPFHTSLQKRWAGLPIALWWNKVRRKF